MGSRVALSRTSPAANARGGLNITLVPAKTWEESFALGERQQCDIFSLLMDCPSRRSFLDFTTPYLEIPGVIATSVNVPFVANLAETPGTPARLRGNELLRESHPGIQLVEVDRYEEGLSFVARVMVHGGRGTAAGRQ